MLDLALINRYLDSQPYPLLFVTVSGAHLYGFDSPDSDYDLRGAHILQGEHLFRLEEPGETEETMDKSGPIDMDLVTHDVRKFFRLLLKNNGYVLEQVYSPIIVHSTPEFEELKVIARSCITKNHNHHFRRFAQNQWDTIHKAKVRTVKGLLYSYRPLLAGIHLLSTGEVESNIVRLNERFRLPYIDDLVAAKRAGQEKGELRDADFSLHESEFNRLAAALEDARQRSSLPELPTGRAAMEDLLVRLRTKTMQ